jgi:hypothetical protein
MTPVVPRAAIVLCSVIVVAQAFALWGQTGRAGLTRFHDPERAARDRQTIANNAILDGPGAVPAEPVAESPNTFALGLLPFGLNRHALSVASLAAPAVLAAIVALIPWRRGPAHRRSEVARQAPTTP